MQALQSLPPIVALVLGVVLLAWVIFAFLVPFMVESIRQSTRKTHLELVELNKKLDQLNAALKEAQLRSAQPATGRLAPEAAPAGSVRTQASEARPQSNSARDPAGARTQGAELQIEADPSMRQGKAAKNDRRRRPEPRGRREPTLSPTDFEPEAQTAPNRRGPNPK